MSDKQWFYAIDGNQNGPVPETQIKNMFDEGQVNEDTLFWTEEMPDWLSASEIVTFETYRKKSPPSLPETSNVSQIRPLVRFAARMIDINVFMMFVGFFIGVFQGQSNAVIIILALFILNFSEAYLISTCSTTFGKWLCGTYVYDSDGSRLAYSKALKRSFLVYVSSCGLYLPIISLATMGSEFVMLRKKGKTYADDKGDFLVKHRKIGAIKTLFVVSLAATFLLLSIWVVTGKS